MEYINMVAPYVGTLEWVGKPKEGSGKSGKPWKNVNFTVKYINANMREQYITFTLTGPEKVDSLMSIPIGTEVRVSWRPITNRYYDKSGNLQWFPQLSAFNVVVTSSAPAGPVAKASGPHAPDAAGRYDAGAESEYDPLDDLPV